MAGKVIFPNKPDVDLRGKKILQLANADGAGQALAYDQAYLKTDTYSQGEVQLLINDFSVGNYQGTNHTYGDGDLVFDKNLKIIYESQQSDNTNPLTDGTHWTPIAFLDGVVFTQAEKDAIETNSGKTSGFDIKVADDFHTPGQQINVNASNTGTLNTTTVTSVQYVEEGLTTKVDDSQLKQTITNDANDIASTAALTTEFATKQDSITGTTSSITIPGAGPNGSNLVFVGGDTDITGKVDKPGGTANTNFGGHAVFVDDDGNTLNHASDRLHLNALGAGLIANADLDVTGSITVGGTVDGVDIDALSTTVAGKQDNIDAILADATTLQAQDEVVTIGFYSDINGTPVAEHTQQFEMKGVHGIGLDLGEQHGTTGLHYEMEISGAGLVPQYTFLPHTTGGSPVHHNIVDGIQIFAFVLQETYTESADGVEYEAGLYIWNPDNDTWERQAGGGGGIDVVTAFPDPATLGQQVFLNVSVSHSDGTNNRPRGFYSYIQPSSDPASRYWEELTISEVGQLFNNARVGDIIYLENAETNFNTAGNDFEPGLYRASATAEDAPNHTTWTAIGGGDTTVIENEIDAIQAHETSIDHRLDVLEAEVANLEFVYEGAYTFVGNTIVNTLLTANRVDSQGNNPSASDILSSTYDPSAKTLRWWIAFSSSDASIDELIDGAIAVGFSDGTKTDIPFVAISRGTNAQNTAKYVDFKLQQSDTYEATLISYADDNEVIFSNTIYFYNTSNVNFNQADTDAEDHHGASALSPAQSEIVASLEVAATTDNLSEFVQVNGDNDFVAAFASQQSTLTGAGDPASALTSNIVTRAGDIYLNSLTTHFYTKLNDNASNVNANWSSASAVTANTVPALDGTTFNASANVLTITAPVAHSVVLEANPDSDANRYVDIEDVRFNETAISNVVSINGRAYNEDELFYVQVKESGTFQNPPTLATAITGQAVTYNGAAVTSSSDDFTTAHKTYNGTDYYLRYQTYGTNQTRVILTEMATPNTALYVHNIT